MKPSHRQDAKCLQTASSDETSGMIPLQDSPRKTADLQGDHRLCARCHAELREPVWIVETGDEDFTWIVGVYESVEAAFAHHDRDDWEVDPDGDWDCGDYANGLTLRHWDVQGMPPPPPTEAEKAAERAAERERLRAEVRKPLPYEEASK